MINTKDFKIILASKSPRRKELLQHIVADFEIRNKEVAEIYPIDIIASEVASFLAKLKASAFEGELNYKEILITSDTTVVLDNVVYGKPKDFNDAISILQKLSGNKHQVITGVCLKSKNKELIFSNTTNVYFKKLSLEEITFYIEKYKPYDKAGAYAIQEWIGFIGIEKIEGDYNNIVGLPLQRLSIELAKFCNSQ